MTSIAVSQLSASAVMISAGTAYMFSLYGPQLQHQLQIPQSKLALIASCANIGLFVGGPIFGSLVNHYSSKSIWFFLFGGIAISTGYVGTSFALAGMLPSHYLFLASLFLLIGFGSASSYHCSLSTNYRNWPDQYRSVAVGLTVSFFGLSAFIFSHLGTSLFLENDVLHVCDFLKFVGGVCFGLNLIAMILLKPKELVQETPAVSTLHEEQVPLIQEVMEHEYAEYAEEQEEQERFGHSSGMSSHIEIERQLSQDLSHPIDIPHDQSVGIELEEISCFRSIDAYILALDMFVLVGSGLMYINNVGSILLALLPPDMDARDPTAQQLQKSHVVLLSLLSFSSRIGTGLLADFGTMYGIKKTMWAIVGAGFMALAFFMGIEMENINGLYIVTWLCGIAYGIVWTIIPILVGEYFGLVSFAKNWGWMTMIPAFGGYFYSSIFAGIYEVGIQVLCKGPLCFEGTFYFSFISCCVCIVGNVVLYIRRRGH